MRCDFAVEQLGEARYRLTCRRCGTEHIHVAPSLRAMCSVIDISVSKGPGDFLHDAILKWVGEGPTRECSCKDRINKMNAWGPAGCREHLQEIGDWLVEEAGKRGWWKYAVIVPGSRYFIDQMIFGAIEAAEREQAKHPAAKQPQMPTVSLREQQKKALRTNWIKMAVKRGPIHGAIILKRKGLYTDEVLREIGWIQDGEAAAKDPLIPSYTPTRAAIPGKVDVVYPLGNGSKWNDGELRYSLRSLEKNFPDLGRVFIVGHKPSWLVGVEHIPMADVHKHNKDANIIDKVLAACRNGLSDKFLFMSDDQILLQPTAFADMRPYHYGDLRHKKESFWGNKWKQRLRATKDVLEKAGHTTLHYDSHVPTPYGREAFIKAVTKFPYRDGGGFTINTLACNAAGGNDGHPMGDLKKTLESPVEDADQIRRDLEGKTFLGYNDAGLTDGLKAVLAEMFGARSRYEMTIWPTAENTANIGQKLDDADLLRRIYLVGSENLSIFGGWYQGAYCLQQSPEEAAEFLTLAKSYVHHPRLLEVGSATGGFARLIDDELSCQSIRIVDNNIHPQHQWRRFRIPHLAGEYIGNAADSSSWLQDQNEKYDLIVIDTDHIYDHEKRHVEVMMPFLENGGLLVLHDSISCASDVGRLVLELKTGLFNDLEYIAEIGKKFGIAVFRKHGIQPLHECIDPQATLLYHFCPHLDRPHVIDFHIRCLARYLPQFTKVRMNIVKGEGFADPDILIDKLMPHIRTKDVEFFKTPNTPDGEVTPFFSKLLPSIGPDENVCYAHSKGAMLSGLPGGLAWAEVMYAHTMNNSRAVCAMLKDYTCFGSFKRIKQHRGAQWHYAGTYFWFKNVQQFDGWQSHISNRYAVEQWLGRFVPEQQAFDNGSFRWLHGLCHNRFGLLDKYTTLPW